MLVSCCCKNALFKLTRILGDVGGEKLQGLDIEAGDLLRHGDEVPGELGHGVVPAVHQGHGVLLQGLADGEEDHVVQLLLPFKEGDGGDDGEAHASPSQLVEQELGLGLEIDVGPYAAETGVNLFQLIVEASAINRKAPSEELIRSVAAKLPKA